MGVEKKDEVGMLVRDCLPVVLFQVMLNTSCRAVLKIRVFGDWEARSCGKEV